MTGYDLDASEILRRLSRKPARMVELDDALGAVRNLLDHRPASVRTAIATKRVTQDAEDLRRFIGATAHLPDDVFEDCDLRDVDGRALVAGLGRRRADAMWRRWYDEPARRAARTAHEVIAEQRLLQR